MTSGFTSLCIDCHHPEELAAFWRSVLDWELKVDEDDGIPYLEAPWGMSLLFAKVPESKTVKNRLHIDVSPKDREQPEEVERILALGARRVDIGQGDVSWVVMADPEGNEFCVLRTRRP